MRERARARERGAGDMIFPLPCVCLIDCLQHCRRPSCDGIQKHLAGSLADLDLLGVHDAMQYHVGNLPKLTDFAASLTEPLPDNLNASGCCGLIGKKTSGCCGLIGKEMSAEMKHNITDVKRRLLRFIEQNGKGPNVYSFQVRGGCMIVVLAQLSRRVLLA